MNVTLSITEEDKKFMKEMAKKDRRSISNLVVVAVRHYAKVSLNETTD